MRYSTIILPAFAAAALAQSSIKAVTTHPAVVTTQPTNSTVVIVPSGSAGNGSSGTNGTVNSASLKSTSKTSSTTSHSSSSTSSTSSTSGSGSSTTSSGSTTSTKKASAADMVQPILGLGFAGVIFAAFL